MFGYSEKKLARDIARGARRIDPDLESTYLVASRSVDIHRVSEPDAPPHQVFLGNIFLKVRDMSRRDRATVIDALLEQTLAPREQTPDELLACLALRVRTPFELNLRARRIGLRDEPREPVTYGQGELLLELVADGEETVSSVSPEALADTHTSVDQAYRIAAATLARATDHDQWAERAPGVWMSAYEDDYDFARLVVAGEDARLPFDGAPIAFAPSHSVCLVTDRTDVETLTRMVNLGDELTASQRPLAQVLWRRDAAGGWEVWRPGPDESHEPGAGVAGLRWAMEQISQHAEQKEYLEALLDSRDEDSFVATYQAFERENGIQSLCTYSFDVPSYLPRTDAVALVDSETDGDAPVLGTIAWDAFEAALGAGALERMDGLVPPVYRLMGALTPDQRAALRHGVAPI